MKYMVKITLKQELPSDNAYQSFICLFRRMISYFHFQGKEGLTKGTSGASSIEYREGADGAVLLPISHTRVEAGCI